MIFRLKRLLRSDDPGASGQTVGGPKRFTTTFVARAAGPSNRAQEASAKHNDMSSIGAINGLGQPLHFVVNWSELR
jgi:hypothetical protein